MCQGHHSLPFIFFLLHRARYQATETEASQSLAHVPTLFPILAESTVADYSRDYFLKVEFLLLFRVTKLYPIFLSWRQTGLSNEEF